MDFDRVFLTAKGGDEAALAQLLEFYNPMLVHYSILSGGRFDEDLYQEQKLLLYRCLKAFDPNRIK